jgi:hypothetical protein
MLKLILGRIPKSGDVANGVAVTQCLRGKKSIPCVYLSQGQTKPLRLLVHQFLYLAAQVCRHIVQSMVPHGRVYWNVTYLENVLMEWGWGAAAELASMYIASVCF